MTLQNLLELVQIDAPGATEGLVRVLAHQAISEFARQTDFFRERREVTVGAGEAEGDLGTSVLRLFSLENAETGEKIDVRARGSLHGLFTGKLVAFLDGGGAPTKIVVGAVGVGDDGRVLAQTTDEALALVADVSVVPALPTLLTDAVPVPDAYMRAITSRILETAAARDLESRSYHHAVWRDLIRQARVDARESGPRSWAVRLEDL